MRLPGRFWDKVDIGTITGCWEWTAAKNSNGYGCFGIDGRSQLAHRLAYEAEVGPIPEGLTIDHLCRNRLCVNPSHLEPVTVAENNRRASRLITHCKRGHELVSTPSGRQRRCPICENAARRIPATERKRPFYRRRSTGELLLPTP